MDVKGCDVDVKGCAVDVKGCAVDVEKVLLGEMQQHSGLVRSLVLENYEQTRALEVHFAGNLHHTAKVALNIHITALNIHTTAVNIHITAHHSRTSNVKRRALAGLALL